MKKDVYIPILCTRGVILFPGQEIIIDVGREISKEAIQEAQNASDNQVFVVSQIDVIKEDVTFDNLYKVGCIGEIKSVRPMKGFLRVRLQGLVVGELANMEYNQKHFSGEINILESITTDEKKEFVLVRRIISLFDQLQNVVPDFPTQPIKEMLSAGISSDELACQIAQYFPFTSKLKQSILEEQDIAKRLILILQQLSVEKELMGIDNELNDEVKNRIDANQKEYYLREKLRVIREELGDVSEKNSDVDTIRKLANTKPYPPNIKEKILEELSRYESLPQAGGESGVIRNYIEWLVKLPWWQESKDNENLNLVQKRLDNDHYGLDKIKERILEYLAVKQMTNSLKAPILCLVGPPGVGKTSLAKSVAKAINRHFVKMSVGGVRDESEIRGHRRTYLGSLPGRIIQGMKKAQVINPVFLIDEIDKMASDFKGDPASAMLEVLDPEQNANFSDHYLEENYDLSKVLFIATANYIENIPDALKDRLEIIELSSYSEEEKLNIAKKHLVAKQLKENGLKKAQFKISDKNLLYLIRYYTREAGVRQLERNLASLIRKSVLEILKNEATKVNITQQLIQKWLGNEKYDYGRKEVKDEIGVVTGLAYTPFGGDILQIEANSFKGSGKLVITGRLGDVMKESANIAYDYVKANAKKYNIDESLFKENDIHIHVPEGATPKDGPSAGITITTALVSLFTNKKVRCDIAMTGEVTLRGNVLPIGGLKEKSLAAHRSGITTIIIPKRNEKDIDELADVVKDNMKIISVSHVSEVIELAIQ